MENTVIALLAVSFINALLLGYVIYLFVRIKRKLPFKILSKSERDAKIKRVIYQFNKKNES